MEAELEVAINMADAVFDRLSGEQAVETNRGTGVSWMASLYQAIDRLNTAKELNVTLGEMADIEQDVNWYAGLTRDRAVRTALDLLSNEKRSADERPATTKNSSSQKKGSAITQEDLRRDAARIADLQDASGCNDW